MVLEKWSSVLNLYCQLSPRLKVTKYFRIGSNCPICVAYLNVLWLFFFKEKARQKRAQVKKINLSLVLPLFHSCWRTNRPCNLGTLV